MKKEIVKITVEYEIEYNTPEAREYVIKAAEKSCFGKSMCGGGDVGMYSYKALKKNGRKNGKHRSNRKGIY